MAIAYIGLGSNLNNPKQQILNAFGRLNQLESVSVVQTSSLYGSKPQGPEDQPDFINAVVKIETTLSPHTLLKSLQQLEVEMGKVKLRHWGERVIDLDILLFGQETIDSDTLTVPHPFMAERDFVLLPLAEIAPGLVVFDGQTVESLIEKLESHYVVRLP